MIATAFQLAEIDFEAVLESVHDDGDGAVVTFIGKARNKSHGKDVTGLHYELYDGMAQKELSRIATQAVSDFGVTNCRVIHRFGDVAIGETSIFIAVTSPHRDNAFKACRQIIDEIKKKVPVWKKEIYADGSHWITEGS